MTGQARESFIKSLPVIAPGQGLEFSIAYMSYTDMYHLHLSPHRGIHTFWPETDIGQI
jgi:hypothetical protein